MTLGWPMQSQRKPKSDVDVAFPTKSGWLLATYNSRRRLMLALNCVAQSDSQRVHGASTALEP